MLFLMKTDRLQPMSGTNSGGENHWWLRDKGTLDVIDPTAEQFNKKEPQLRCLPYGECNTTFPLWPWRVLTEK